MRLLSWPRYLTWTLATALAAIAACGAFNVFIDPLGIYGSPRFPGLNVTKPYLDHHRTIARWKAAQRICPNAGIFGNSRAEIGFDPEHGAFRSRGHEAFNHAIPGSGLSDAIQQLSWLRSAGCPPRVVILGVDFFDFLGGSALATNPAPVTGSAPQIDGATLAETAFSVTATRDSLNTVAVQRARYAATISPRGFNPLLNYIPEVGRSGHYSLFRQRAVENLKIWSSKPRRIHAEGGGPTIDYADLATFLSLAASSAESVHVVIYPYHAQIRLMMERAELGGLFAEWKASMLTSALGVANTGGQIRVWDFSGIADETLEEIPPRGDRQRRLNYYWEAGHFKSALGDRILQQILVGDGGFGVLLEEGRLQSWLQDDRERVRGLLARPSALLAEVDSLFSLPGTRR